jgi:SAM-dependent methyltransferase
MDNYHERQYDTEYDSTKLFRIFLASSLNSHDYTAPQSLLDIGCGAGSNTRRIADWYPASTIKGIDNNPNLIDYAHKKNEDLATRMSFSSSSLFDLTPGEAIGSGIISIQTLSWIPCDDLYEPLRHIFGLGADWVCFSALGFVGNVDASIQVNDFSSDKAWSTPYNIFSNNKITNLALHNGYSISNIQEYSPPCNIISSSNGMGSYTEEFADGRLRIFSGPLYLPWYFYFFGKKSP